MADDRTADLGEDHVLRTLINPPMPSVEKLPKLRTVLDGAAEAAARHLQEHIADPISLELAGLKEVAAGEAFPESTAQGVSGVFHADEWGADLIVHVTREGIDTLVDALFGGDGSEAPLSSDGPLSTIQNSVAGFLFALFAKGLETAFGGVLATKVALQRLEEAVDLDAIGGEITPVVSIGYTLTIFERAHPLLLLVPASAITPFRRMFEASDADIGSPDNKTWQRRMRSEVSHLRVPLRTVLDEYAVSLNELSNLAVGATLLLKATPESLATVECRGQPLFRCQVGREFGAYTLRIEERLGSAPDVVMTKANRKEEENHDAGPRSRAA